MIAVAPYDDTAAMAVMSRLDLADLAEAQLIRGAPVSHLALFADWRAMRPGWVTSHVLLTSDGLSGQPFALVAIGNTGQAGVAQAAFLARDHRRFRRSIATAALIIRASMPDFCAVNGIHRIEARCWADHPTALQFLRAVGFHIETAMPGFGPGGCATFLQCAYVHPSPEANPQEEPAQCA